MTAITPHASTARTASGTGSSIDLTAVYSAVQLRLLVSAVTGTTPTLVVTLQTSDDNTFFRDVSNLTTANVTTTGVWEISLSGLDRYIRVTWTIGGTTPSFTFKVVGQSYICYASFTDVLSHAAPAEAFPDKVTTTIKAEGLLWATSKVNSYLQVMYDPPLTSWGHDIRRCTAILAAYNILVTRGYFRDDTTRDNLQKQYDQEIAWLVKVKDGELVPDNLVDNTPTEDGGASYTYTRTKRGWGTR